MTNLKRFREVLSYIEAHPWEWDQKDHTRCFLATAGEMFGKGGTWHTPCGYGRHALGLTRGSPVESWLFGAHRTIDDFRTLDLRVATVTAAALHPKADRLLVLTVDLGGEQRQLTANQLEVAMLEAEAKRKGDEDG